jgi:hypothetical protein
MLEPFDDPLDAIREYDCTPPALSTSGRRRLFRRLSAATDVDHQRQLEGLPDAARRPSRDWRDVLPRSRAFGGPASAPSCGPSTTSEMYSHIEASELSDIGSKVFEDER